MSKFLSSFSLRDLCLIMISTIRDVDCCAHTKSLLTQQFQSEAWDLICMYIIVHALYMFCIDLSLYHFFSLSKSLSFCPSLSLCLSVFLPISLSLSLYLSALPFSLCLSVFLSISHSLSLYLSALPSLSVFLSFSLSLSLSF